MAREEKVWEYAMDAGFTPLEDRCIIVKGAAGDLSEKIVCFFETWDMTVLQMCENELILLPFESFWGTLERDVSLVIPYAANVTAEYVTRAEEVKPLLERQVYSSVKWQQSVERMIADGVDRFVEIGPGKTLTGFVKKISRDVKAVNIEKLDDLEKLKEL